MFKILIAFLISFSAYAYIPPAGTVGYIQWPNAGANICNWSISQAAFTANFSDVAACGVIARTVYGNVTDSSAGVRPEIRFTARAGTYRFTAMGSMNKANVNSMAQWRFFDGTKTSTAAGMWGDGASGMVQPTIVGTITYSAAEVGVKTVNMQCRYTGSAVSCGIDLRSGDKGELQIMVEYLPLVP